MPRGEVRADNDGSLTGPRSQHPKDRQRYWSGSGEPAASVTGMHRFRAWLVRVSRPVGPPVDIPARPEGQPYFRRQVMHWPGDDDSFHEAREIVSGQWPHGESRRRAYALYHGDCIEVMKSFPDNSVDSIVSDPPYGLGLMGKKWDAMPPGDEFAKQALRVLKPGGHVIAFGGTRTSHRLAVALEDAGFEIRDTIHWHYWSGFPHGRNIAAEIDKKAVRDRDTGEFVFEAWDGWNTALKPSIEPAVLARKPLSEQGIAANILKWGTGGLNIDACRMPVTDDCWTGPKPQSWVTGQLRASKGGDSGPGSGHGAEIEGSMGPVMYEEDPRGWWPANLYQCAKPGRAEREAGLDGFEEKKRMSGLDEAKPWVGSHNAYLTGGATARRNNHPTVKPIKLMRWLCRLVTPPGGVVLDPFMGSGSTGCAAMMEGFDFIGIELFPLPPDHPDYDPNNPVDAYDISAARIAHWRELAVEAQWVQDFGSLDGLLAAVEGPRKLQPYVGERTAEDLARSARGWRNYKAASGFGYGDKDKDTGW